jgi:uncharacterized membrane protein YwaF
MFELMRFIFKDRTTDTFSFKPFSICHILYLLIIIFAIVSVLVYFKNKDKEFKVKVVNYTLNTAFILYIADFFIMPLSQGEIAINKLPFHLCTLMSILCFISRHTKSKMFATYKNSFTLLGMIGALMYLVYPAGVRTGAGEYFDGYTYRIIQTVLYHGLMLAQGVFAIAYGDIELKWSNFKYDIIAILCIIIWAMFGNAAFTGTVYGPCDCVEGCLEMVIIYDEEPNWFFVQHDPLYIFPNDTDSYYSPFIMISAITGMCALMRFLSDKILGMFRKKQIIN